MEISCSGGLVMVTSELGLGGAVRDVVRLTVV
jgi:hypothetical protein